MNDLEQFREDFGLSGEARQPAPEHPGIDRSRWGIFEVEDVEQYHAGNPRGALREGEISISQSQFGRALDETMLDFAFHHPQLNPDREKLAATVAQHRGDIVHQLALGKGRGFAISPYDEYRTGEAKAWRDGVIRAGQTPTKRKDFEAAEVMAEILRERIAEALDGCEYQTEVGFLFQHMTTSGPIWVRGMVDIWCPDLNTILDLKVTPMIYDTKVERQLVNMGWDRQGALYSHAFGVILGASTAGRIKFRDLMVKPTEPFTARLVELDKGWHWSAWKRCEEAMERFGRCLYAGRWPGFEGVHRAQLPTWEDKKREALEMGGE